ncbi:cytochrome P450 [Amanita rubescens]|nr:cytochrome P450 [Amanita rubescens]KAF8351755.1 cytochrome P450 [Amanita rubescens]
MGTNILSPFLAVLALVITYYVPFAWRATVNNWKLRSIPSVGSGGLLTSFIGAWRFRKHAHEMGQEGYSKYRGSFFKVPTMSRWMILVSGARNIEEIRNAPEEHLSFHEAMIEIMRLDATVGPEIHNPLYINVITNPFTQSIRPRFADIQDEIKTAFADYIPAGQGNEWVKVNVFSTMMDITCRTSNRVFVGLPFARDPDFIRLNKEFSINVIKAYRVVNRFPSFLRSFASRFANVSNDIKRAMRHLDPLIKERLEQEAKHGKDWPNKPNDLISWLLDASQGGQRDIRSMAINVLLVNLAAIHTVTMSFTYILYDLATHPEYVQPMREEVEAALQEDGWTHASIGKLSKVDSFVKESLRSSVVNTCRFPPSILNAAQRPAVLDGLKRLVMKDYTFSDGTTIPAGNIISVPMLPIHLDPDIYTNPKTFDGFRFEKMRKERGEDTKHKLASLDLDYLVFGNGRQACPGRFFAAVELKTMLAHVLLNYDIKMANGAGRPANITIASEMMPDPSAKVLFRKRFMGKAI